MKERLIVVVVSAWLAVTLGVCSGPKRVCEKPAGAEAGPLPEPDVDRLLADLEKMSRDDPHRAGVLHLVATHRGQRCRELVAREIPVLSKKRAMQPPVPVQTKPGNRVEFNAQLVRGTAPPWTRLDFWL